MDAVSLSLFPDPAVALIPSNETAQPASSLFSTLVATITEGSAGNSLCAAKPHTVSTRGIEQSEIPLPLPNALVDAFGVGDGRSDSVSPDDEITISTQDGTAPPETVFSLPKPDTGKPAHGTELAIATVVALSRPATQEPRGPQETQAPDPEQPLDVPQVESSDLIAIDKPRDDTGLTREVAASIPYIVQGAPTAPVFGEAIKHTTITSTPRTVSPKGADNPAPNASDAAIFKAEKTTQGSPAAAPPPAAPPRPVQAARGADAPSEGIDKDAAPQPPHSPDTQRTAATSPAIVPRAADPAPPFATQQPSPPSPPPVLETVSAPALPNSVSTSPPQHSNADTPVRLAAAARSQTPDIEALALHIAARTARGDSRFAIRLDPPELGRIEVSLSVNSQGHAQAALAAEKPQTLEILQRDASTLERTLRDAGLDLGGNLSFSLKGEGRSPFLREDQAPPSSRLLEVTPAETTSAHATLSGALLDHLYGLRAARLDITV